MRAIDGSLAISQDFDDGSSIFVFSSMYVIYTDTQLFVRFVEAGLDAYILARWLPLSLVANYTSPRKGISCEASISIQRNWCKSVFTIAVESITEIGRMSLTLIQPCPSTCSVNL